MWECTLKRSYLRLLWRFRILIGGAFFRGRQSVNVNEILGQILRTIRNIFSIICPCMCILSNYLSINRDFFQLPRSRSTDDNHLCLSLISPASLTSANSVPKFELKDFVKVLYKWKERITYIYIYTYIYICIASNLMMNRRMLFWSCSIEFERAANTFDRFIIETIIPEKIQWLSGEVVLAI